ncbi:MAG: tRNA (N(6)-L-threonylcarbamoyladenosine(37)-C(2))-methylthiotransferase MtaB [Gemmataceae bacterium]
MLTIQTQDDPTPTTSRLCRLVTLGCKVNQYETQYVKETLELSGYHEAQAGEQADLCVVNTCTVTAEGDSKSRRAVRKLHQNNPNADILVMGCYATRDPQAVAQLPGVVKVITDKTRLAEDLREFGVEQLPQNITRFDNHHRAFVKVQDGCLLNCSYCIIPSVRPTLRSRPIDDISEEVAALVASGFQEIVLTGIHLGHYGIDISKGKPKSEWNRLWHLLETLGELPGDFRIRLSSLEAAEARDDLVRVMSALPKVVPHLHLCLQSGSDRILKAMKRRYSAKGFLARCEKLKDALDQPAFTTDVILGFPGETEEDFQATCDVVREVGFSKVHIFPYSTREGTEATRFGDQLPKAVVTERRQRLQELEQEMAEQYYQRLLGRQLDVLVESDVHDVPGFVTGTSCRYAPTVFRGHAEALKGKIVPVLAERFEKGRIVGTPLPPEEVAETQAVQTRYDGPVRLSLPLVS